MPRPSWPRLVWPAPVALWALLVAGHLLSGLAPVPALLWPAALAVAAGAGAASLGFAVWTRLHPGANGAALSRLEGIGGFLSIFFAGVALGAEMDRATWPLPVHPRERLVTLEGKVLDTTATDATPAGVLIEARRVRVGDEEAPCRARLWLRWRGEVIPPRWILPGLWLQLSGAYRPPEDARNAGESASGRWLERTGVAGTVAVDPISITAPSEPPERGAGWGAVLRDWVARAFSEDLSSPVAALARGMLLGDRSGIAPGVREAFRDGGTIHILSISGLHVCILAGFLALFFTIARLPLSESICAELAALWSYVLLVGSPASAIRSAFLWSAVRLGRLRGQVVRPFTAWGLAGLGLHLLDPAAPADPGFQLSFAAVLGLGASGSLSRVSKADSVSGGAIGARVRSMAGSMWGLLVQSAGATAGTMGIQSRLFGAVPFVGLVLNLAVIPLCTLFMAEAVLYLFLRLAGVPPFLQAGAGALEGSGLLLLALNDWGARLIHPWIVPSPPSVAATAVAALALLLAWARAEAARGGDPPRRSAALWSIGALLLSALLPFAPPVSFPGETRRNPVLVALDVGQGDAAWVGLPGGASILVDAGPADERGDAGERVIEPALRAEGCRRVDASILSHAHLDHFGGYGWLSRRGWIEACFENGSDPRGSWREPIRAALHDWGRSLVTVGRDTTLALNGCSRVTLLRGMEGGGENDRSLTAILKTAGATALFPGDLEAAGEAAVLPQLMECHVLKAPHHGSRTSSTAEWVERTRPRVVLISCGERNRFGHPDPAVLDRYRRAGAMVLRTDQEGAIRVTLTPEGGWVSTRSHPEPRFVRWGGKRDGVTPSSHSP